MANRRKYPPEHPFQSVSHLYSAARKLVGWTQQDLARETGIASDSISRFERGQRMRPENIGKIVKTLEAAGVKFIRDGGALIGVSLKKRTSYAKRKAKAFPDRYPDAESEPADTGHARDAAKGAG
jgi:transcriptional regulator with XRE-family HTH domain